MQRFTFRCFVTASLLFMAPNLGISQEGAGVSRSQQQEEIIRSIRSYVDAYNKRDAKAIASHWASDGHWLNQETGERVRGVAAIEKQFSEIFASPSASKLDVDIDSIRFLSDDVAIEEGVAKLVDRFGLSNSNYIAIHVKEQGAWKLDSVRESVPVVADQGLAEVNKLDGLAWLIGSWTNVGPSGKIEANCQWTKNRRFITRSFKEVIDGTVELEGTQVIGWDPKSETIRSWMFDSDGGFGKGNWRNVNGNWEIELNQTLPDGSSASCVNLIRPLDADRFAWSSKSRVIDGTASDDVSEIQFSRNQN